MTGIILLSLAAVIGAAGGPLCAETPTTETINIATSNVATDLTALYGANLKSAVPSRGNGDLYGDFKYLTALSRAGEMYFYVYFDSATPLSGATISYSDSKAIGSSGGYLENSKTATLTLLNTWGSERVFYKFKCDQLYAYNPGASDGSQTHRFRAVNFTGLGQNGASLTKYGGQDWRSCEVSKGGYIWNDEAENADQVYDYYKDNYIVIGKDSLCSSQLIESDKLGSYWWSVGAGSSVTSELKENHWLFFNVEDYHVADADQFDLKYLIGATLRYQPVSYDMVYYLNERADFVNGTLPRIYTGVYLDAQGNPQTASRDSFIESVKASTDSMSDPRWASFENVSYKEAVLKTLTADDLTSTVKQEDSGSYPISNIPGVAKGNWDQTYEWNRVYRMDVSSIDSIPADDDHAAIKNYLGAKAGQFDWAINFDQTTRTFDSAHAFNNLADWWWDQCRVTTKCTDIADAQFTTLTFSNGYKTADLNAIMDPVSTSEASTSPTARVTYTSAIVDSVADLIGFLWDTLSTGLKVLSVVAVVAIGIVLAYFFVVAILKIRGGGGPKRL